MLRLLCLLFLVPLLVACTADEPRRSSSAADEDTSSIPFRTDGSLEILRDGEELVTIDIEIADTDSSRQRGLMGRTSLPEQSGMLFIFPDEAPRSFWMADTPLSLDILFADADSQIVRIAKYTRPYSSDQIQSGDPARFVLEVPAGFSDRRGIVEGDRLRWSRD